MCLESTWGGGGLGRTPLPSRHEEGGFDAEVFAIWRAIRILDRRQGSGHRYTVFIDSMPAIDRVRTDAIGPGQCFAMAAMEACGRVLTRDNELTIRWVPAHHGV